MRTILQSLSRHSQRGGILSRRHDSSSAALGVSAGRFLASPSNVPHGSRFFASPFGNESISAQNLSPVREMRNPGEILSFYADHPTANAATLEACIRALGRSPMNKQEFASLISDDRFQQLLKSIKGRVADMDTRLLSMIVNALSILPRNPICDEITDLAQHIADVAVRRENSYAPKNLSTMVQGLAFLGMKDPALIEFFRLESIKLMPDLSPADLYLLMDGFRSWGALNRELTDMIIEKMTDEIDRYTSKDVVETLAVLARIGLARGFLIRRLASLSFENLNQFNTKRLISLLSSLSKLRFLSEENYVDVVDIVKQNMGDLYGPFLTQLSYSLAMGNCLNMKETVRDILKNWHLNAAKPRSLAAQVDAAYCILYFQFEDMDDVLKDCLTAIFEDPRSSRNTAETNKITEIIAALSIERKDLKIPVPEELKAALDDTEKWRGERFENSRAHGEVQAIAEGLLGKYQLRLQRNQEVGPYRAELLDQETKIIVEMDLLVKTTNCRMRCRHFQALGYHPVLIHFWQWRRCKSETEQVHFLKQALEEALQAAGNARGHQNSASS